ncbi:MAG: alpha-glucan family phosphorylase [Gammaproteobacteria bacterium]|jgi:starch phosphorylase
MERLQRYFGDSRIGYFSMEIAIGEGISTYSGGLGVLAGDTVRTAADLRIPMVAVSLVSRAGYFRQEIADGRQIEHPDPWQPEEHARRLPAKVSVTIEDREVWICAWVIEISGLTEGARPIVLLDTDLYENTPEDRRLTDVLYGGDKRYRLKQEIVLGIGGVRMLKALGFNIDLYHLNEGHCAFLTLQLLREHRFNSGSLAPGELPYDIHRVRKLCNFTTHTPVEAGQDKFDYALVEEVLDEYVERDVLRQLAGNEELNTTRLALNLSEFVNGVAKTHARTAQRLYPGFHLSAITNGIHPPTWLHSAFASLYDSRLPGWRAEPELLMRVDCCVSGDEVRACHVAAKDDLIKEVYEACGTALSRGLPIIGYGRRITGYKRPTLLFQDIEKLRAIARRYPFQIVLAGKAHPRDEPGKRAIEQLHRFIEALQDDIRVVFLPNYDTRVAKLMIAGSDIWLNTPEPPLEASGTSGMKAALNGVPNLSILDGWWVEGHIEGITGWAIGDGDADSKSDADAASLYDKLENVILPLYNDEHGWTQMMKGAISRNGSIFHSHRMMRRYATEAYLT